MRRKAAGNAGAPYGRPSPYSRNDSFPGRREFPVAVQSHEGALLDENAKHNRRNEPREIYRERRHAKEERDHPGVGGMPDNAVRPAVHDTMPLHRSHRVRIKPAQCENRPHAQSQAGREGVRSRTQQGDGRAPARTTARRESSRRVQRRTVPSSRNPRSAPPLHGPLRASRRGAKARTRRKR